MGNVCARGARGGGGGGDAGALPKDRATDRMEVSPREPRVRPPALRGAAQALCEACPNQLVAGSAAGEVVLWNWKAGATAQVWKGHSKAVSRVGWLPRSRQATSGSRDATVKLWAPGEAAARATLEGHRLVVTGLAPDPDDESRLCTGSRDNTMRLWDLSTSQQVREDNTAQNLVTCISWIPGEKAVLQASEDLSLRVWDARSLKVAQRLEGHVNIPMCCAVSADGTQFLTCSNGFEGTGSEVRLWDRRAGKTLQVMEGHTQSVHSCLFIDAGAARRMSQMEEGACVKSKGVLASCSADGTLRVWDKASGAEIQSVSPRDHGLGGAGEGTGEGGGAMLSMCELRAGTSASGGTSYISTGSLAGQLFVWAYSHRLELAALELKTSAPKEAG